MEKRPALLDSRSVATTPDVARAKANLFGELNGNVVVSLDVRRDEDYGPNDWLHTDDGGSYVIAEVRAGEPPFDVELDAIWVDGPDPTTLVQAS
jgi:hypothetical protein